MSTSRSSLIPALLSLLVSSLAFAPALYSQNCQPPPPPTCGLADQCGKWNAPLSLPHPSNSGSGPGMLTVMRTGDVLLFYDATDQKVRRFHPATDTVGPAHDPSTNVPFVPAQTGFFCGSQSQLGDGRILIIGGATGHHLATIYDPLLPVGSCFLQAQAAPVQRFYPSSLTLATGKVLALAGTGGPVPPATLDARTPTIYDPHTNQWQTLDQATHCGQKCDACSSPTTTIYIRYYPHVFQVPDGRTLYVGGPQAALLGEFCQGNLRADYAWALDTMRPAGGTTSRWQQFTSNKKISSVLSVIHQRLTTPPSWQVMKLGGADEAGADTDNNLYALDPASLNPSWQAKAAPAPSWANASIEATAYFITLPNGKMLALGQHQVPQIYDPEADVWQVAATMPKIPNTCDDRGWHSAAALLPDARVLIVGGRRNTTPPVVTSDTGQIFNPPYLYRNTTNPSLPCDTETNCEFLGPSHPARPSITSIPQLVATGSSFEADVTAGGSPATRISSVCFIRPGSSQHSIEFDQRFIPLEFGPPNFTGTLSVFTPASADEAPPGYYMFFVVNNVGRPSAARFVQVWGIVKSSITGPTLYCASGVSKIRFDTSWLTSLEGQVGAMDQLVVSAPGASPVVRQALPPDPDDLRSHRVLYEAPCQLGTWTYVIKSYRGAPLTESQITMTVNVTSCPSCCPAQGCGEIE